MELSELLLLLLEFFLGTGTLLADHKVAITVVLDAPLLDGINLDVLATDVIFRLRNLTLQVLNHLLTRLEHLLFRVVIGVSTVELSLLLLKLQLHLLNVLLHALRLEVISL